MTRPGPPPATAALKVTRDAKSCGDTVPDERWVVGEAGGVANVVIKLVGAPPPANPPPPATALIDQVGCRYDPHVLAVPAGSKVRFKNSDLVLHNVHGHAVPEERTRFNYAMPRKDQVIPRKLKKPGVIRLGCDAGHTWMTAWIHVTEHPWVAVTANDGRFELTGVPPGEHTLQIWHEVAGVRTLPVTVLPDASAAAATEVAITLP